MARRDREGRQDAQAEGAIDLAEDPEQLTFELESYVLCANTYFVIQQERTPMNRAGARSTDGSPSLRLPRNYSKQALLGSHWL